MEIKYSLHDKQCEVFNDTSRYKVVVAGRRFGKTILAMVSAIIKALQKNNSKVWFVAPTYKQSELIAWKLLKKLLPESIIEKKNEVKLEVVLKNGSELSLKGADNEDSLRGVGLDYVVLDEYATMKPHVWQEIIRPMLTDTQGQALFIGTPKGKNSLFELYLKGQRKDNNWNSWKFETKDNPFIEDGEIEDAKKQLSDRVYKQEYEASFEDYVGLVWSEFGEQHIIEPHYVDSMFPRIGAIDPAISGTTAVVKAYIDEDGVITVYDEFYKKDVRVSEVVPEIKEDGVSWFIDPSSAAKNIVRDGKLYTVFNEYSDHGINPRPAENDVNAGINRVAEMFKSGKIRIFSSCVNLIHELERYHWAESRETRTGMMKPEPYKHMDHLCDCLRYIVMSRSPKAHIEIKPKIEKGSVAEIMLQDEIIANDWRRKYE